MNPPPDAPPRPRIYYGWWMVAITSAMTFFAAGVFFRGFTVFVPAIRDALGISQAQTNLIFALARAEGGLEGPFAGWLIDKFGNKKLLIPAIVWAALGYFILSRYVDNLLTFTLVYLLMVSVGNSISFQHAVFAGLNQWFRRRRALAISILAAVASLGGLIIVPPMNWLITRHGWQAGVLVSGIAYLVFLLPLTVFFRNRPEDMGLLPDGDLRPPVAAGTGRPGQRGRELRDYTVREAMHTRSYWLMMLGAGLRMTATLGILISIVPILESKGVSRQAAANMTGIMFGINFLSRLALGFFADRWNKSYILSVTLAFECLGFIALLFGDWGGSATFLILLFILFEGFGDGAGIIVWAALGDYFGRDRFASLRGYITFSHSWALVASPVFAGWAFDHFGNYNWPLGLAACFAAAASFCFLLTKKPPQLTKEEPDPAAELEVSA